MAQQQATTDCLNYVQLIRSTPAFNAKVSQYMRWDILLQNSEDAPTNLFGGPLKPKSLQSRLKRHKRPSNLSHIKTSLIDSSHRLSGNGTPCPVITSPGTWAHNDGLIS